MVPIGESGASLLMSDLSNVLKWLVLLKLMLLKYSSLLTALFLQCSGLREDLRVGPLLVLLWQVNRLREDS